MTGEPLNRARLVEQLILHEGLRLRLYTDSRGKRTIGVGYNVTDRGVRALSRILMRSVTLKDLETYGLAHEECLLVLDADITQVEETVRARFPLYDRLNDPRKRAVLDFVFNLGIVGAAAFKHAIDALTHAIEQPRERIRRAFYYETAWHVMDSLYARQIDDGLAGKYGRADRVCELLISGEDFSR